MQSNQYWHLLAKADEALLNQEYSAAKRYFTQVRQLSPYKSEAYIGLGDTELAQHQLEQAERYYQQALQYQPNDAATLHSLTKLYRQQSHQKAAQFMAN
ncbi:tetratricopeptide repeat protein, partial [Proteus mirabilis]